MSAASVVRVGERTKARPDRPKLHPRETDDDVIARLTEIAIDDEPLSDETLEHLRRSEGEIRAGRTRRLAEIARDLDLE
ncbi:MAG TPA: hypothetical protein HA263_10040 [Methanoregulaceae archaeon]|nr:hypothetical protein [Methanoregulaceae archaeon]